MIRIKCSVKLNPSNLIPDLKKKIQGLPQHINSYVIQNIQTVLDTIDRKVRMDIIYGPGGVKRRTGALGRDFGSQVIRINQYTFKVVSGFMYSVPYVNTHVGDQGFKIIYPDKKRYLWVPKKGGPADVYPRQPVSAFYNQYVNKKPHGLQAVYNLCESVRIPQRIDPSEIEGKVQSTLDNRIPRIASKALNNWKKMHGY